VTTRNIFFGVGVAAYLILLACDVTLIYRFNEFEPKFGPGFKLGIAVVGDLVIAVAIAALVLSARAVWNRSRIVFVVVLALPVLGLTVYARSNSFKTWNARRAVRYVYWRNFHQGRRPLPSIHALEHPRLQLLLHGFIQLHNDPWGHPYHYELINDVGAAHPHRENWDVDWAFWSNGPDGIDDGTKKRDDIDVTNSGL